MALTGCSFAGQEQNPSPTLTSPSATSSQATARPPDILVEGLDFPEGPAFDPQGELWCTELQGGNLVRVRAGKVDRFAVDGRPNGLAFDRPGRAWVCDSGQNSIRRLETSRRLDVTGNRWQTMLSEIDGEPLLAPNDLAFDSKGNLLFTCPNFSSEDPLGYVACLRPDGTARKIAKGLYRPNGLDFIQGGQVLVVGDTYRKILLHGPWDPIRCEWGDPQTWANVGGKEGPDGMAPGADGLLYVAIFGDGVIRVLDNQGTLVREIALPGMNPTNAAFDPGGRLGLVVTETEKGQLLSFPDIHPGPSIYDGGSAWP